MASRMNETPMHLHSTRLLSAGSSTISDRFTFQLDTYDINLVYLVKRMLVGLRIKHILDGFTVRVPDTRRLIDGNEIGVGRRGVGARARHDVL